MPKEMENDIEKDVVDIAEIEKEISNLEAKLAKLGAKGGLHYPHSDDADMEGSGKKNTAGHQRRVKVHKRDDDEVEKAKDDSSDDDDDDDDDDMGKVAKAKKKPMKSDDIDDEGDADDWSQKREPMNDETIVVGGQQITKSLVGEGSFAIIKAQQDAIAKVEAEVKKERDLRLTAEMQKRADELYKHAPCSTEERAEMLKAMETMPEALRKSFETVLTQSNKLAKAAFDRVGINPADLEAVQKSAKDFDAKVTEIAKRDSVSRDVAMSKARKEAPEAFEAFQKSGDTVYARRAN